MNIKTYFYYLKHPVTLEVRYIGQSKNPMQRLFKHISSAKTGTEKNTRKSTWIRHLLTLNLRPVYEIFEEFYGTPEDAWAREWELIKVHLDGGCRLVNGNDGGVLYLLPDARVKKVYQYDKNTGALIKEYRCAFDAYSETSIKDAIISRCCKEEGIKARFPGGYLWSYKKYIVYPLHQIPIPATSRKAVISTNLITGRSQWFISAREAGKVLGLSYKNISGCLTKRQKTTKNYTFEFAPLTQRTDK